MWQDKKYQFITLFIYLYENHLVWDEVGFAGREFTLYYTDIISVSGGNAGKHLGGTSRFEINTAGQTYKYNSTLGAFNGLEECIQIINERIQHFRNNGMGSANSASFANNININPNNIEPTITRIDNFLEDGEWDKVYAYSNAALDYFPTDFRLYKYLLLADMKCKTVSDLKNCSSSFATNGNYKKLERYADDSLKKELKDILEYIEKEPIYRQAYRIKDKDKKKAIELFTTVRGYKDSNDHITALQNKIRTEERQKKEKDEKEKNAKYLAAVELHNRAETLDDYKRALDAFEKLNDLMYEDSQYRYTAIKKRYDELVREKEYSDAIDLLSSGEVSKVRTSKKIFDKLQDYGDSKTKAAEAQSIIAEADKKRKKVLILIASILAAVLVFTTIILPMMSRNSLVQEYGESTVEKFSGVNVGDTFTLGTYEQDNNTSDGAEDIEWLVLDKKGNDVLAVSVYQLDCRTFHTEHAEVTWETCELRNWLNTEFFNSAFTQEEQKLIPEVLVSADENPEFSTDPGNDTKDRVFLLSVPEVNKYLGTNYDCDPTAFVEANHYGNTWWWLRSPGDDATSHALVDCYDDDISYNPCLQKGGIRPAIWVSMN